MFTMLTGVTKFGKVSVFSDLNNLDDISMWNKLIDICGVSEQELYDNLDVRCFIRVDTLLLRDMMKNWVFTVWVFLIVKWKKVLSVFCFLIMQAWIKWNLPLKFRNSFVRYVPVIKIEIIFVCCFQTAKSSGKCCFQTANGYLCI